MVVGDVGGGYFSGLRRCLKVVAVGDGLCDHGGEWFGSRERDPKSWVLFDYHCAFTIDVKLGL